MVDLLTEWFTDLGLNAFFSDVLTKTLMSILVLILSVIAVFITRRVIMGIVERVVEKTKTHWDDIFVKEKVFSRLSHFVPAIILHYMAPVVFADDAGAIAIIDTIASIYMIVVSLLVIDALLNTALAIYRTYEVSRRIPIKSFIQVTKVTITFIGAILIISVLIGQSPVVLVAGLGALSAVLLLVFQQPILGFVAGIQLSANKMISRGDWIEMPKYNADGDVLDVTLTTVKVQNWDKTISYIPSSAFLQDTFRNWRGMSESGGRRIKRSVNIDMNSIKFCTEEMLAKFSKIQYISEYIERKKRELDEHNQAHNVDTSTLVNGRHLTNIGTFRAYVAAYLKNHPMVHKDMTFLVRQLPPSEHGLPIEIYVFSKDQVWANYEGIQADIFDHILAVIPEFELKVFQNPTGRDFQSVFKNGRA